MATTASRSRLFPARSRKSYRLEMEGRTLYLLLSLMALTGLVVFYLGVVTGKALRNPNAPVALSTELRVPAPEEPSTPSKQSLAFNEALKAKDSTIEGLRIEQARTSQRTRVLLSRAEKEMALEEIENKATPTVAPVRGPVPPQASPAPPPAARQPALAPAAKRPGLYTVQVFSSRQQQRARELMNKLKGMGFSAYLNRYEAADNQVWYRVRVGKTTRTEAESLKDRLKKKARMKDPRVQKL